MMKMVRLMATGLVGAMIAVPVPAWAAFCVNEGPQAPLTFEERDGESVLVTDIRAQASLDRQRLREAGVAATSVERWNGCLRAFVERGDGTRAMEIYDPVTLGRLQ